MQVRKLRKRTQRKLGFGDTRRVNAKDKYPGISWMKGVIRVTRNTRSTFKWSVKRKSYWDMYEME